MRPGSLFGTTSLTLVAICACGGPPSSSATGDGSAAPPSVTIRFIHYNDFHAHLVAHTTLIATPEGSFPGTPAVAMRGGIARVATKIKALRAEMPPGASVLMNIGDTYHGGVEALYTEGEAVATSINALGIDVGVPGNWDYAYGPEVTRLRYLGNATIGMRQCVQEGLSTGAGSGSGGGVPTLTMPSFPNLAANVTFLESPSTTANQPFLPGTLLKDVGGAKVGFIGLSSDIVPRMHPMLACGLQFLGITASGGPIPTYSIDPNWTAEYKALVESSAQTLRSQGAQVVVVMSELGVQKNHYLGDVIAPGTVDVIFSAHTHETVFAPLGTASGALVVEAGDDTYVGHMDIQLTNGKITDRAWKLEPVTMDIAEDPAIAALVDVARAPFLVANPNLTIPGNTGAQYTLTQPIDTVIGYATQPLTRKNALDSSFNDFFTQALAAKARTTLAMAPGFRYDSPIATSASNVEGTVTTDGRVTIEDAFRFFPVIHAMATARTSGANLDAVIEDSLDPVFTTDMTQQSGGWVEGFSGLRVSVDLASAKGSRVTSMTLADGTPIDPASSYSIAGCVRPFDATGVLCSHDGFVNVQQLLKPDNTPWTDVEIFMDGIAHSRGSAAPSVFSDISGTAVWPQVPFVQPLEGAKGP